MMPAAPEAGFVEPSKVELSASVEVPLPFVIEMMDKRIATSTLYTDLVVYIPFLIMFTFFAYGGRDITGSYYTGRVLRDLVLGNEIDDFEVVKLYEDISSAEEWLSWFKTTLIPNVFIEETADSTRTMQGRNYLLGALRVRTQRASNTSCSPSSHFFEDPDATPCYGSLANGEETALLHGFPNHLKEKEYNGTGNLLYRHYDCSDVSGGQYIYGYMHIYHCGGYVIDIPFEKSQAEATWLADKFIEYPFLDFQTRFLSVEFFVYTPSTNAFTSVKLFTEVSPSGAYLPQYQFRTFLMWTEERSQGQTVLDFFFFAYVMYYVYCFIRDWTVFYRRRKKILAFLFNTWNFLELSNLVTLLVVFSLRWAWWDISKQSDDSQFPYAPRYPKDLDHLLSLYSSTVYANSLTVTISFIKTVKFLRLNPRFGVLTMTISEKKSQLIGILILFAWCVLAYALCGMSLFGSSLWEFHSVDIAYTTLLRMLVGDFEMLGQENDTPGEMMENRIYGSMRNENRVLAGVFFWTYVTLVFFLLLNMIIAVLAEGFSNVSSKFSSIPLSDEIARAVESIRRACSSDRLANQFRLCRQGMTTSDILVRARDHIEEHHRNVLGEHLHEEQAAFMIDLPKLQLYMGDEYNKLGSAYVMDMWYEITMDYEDSMETKENIAAREMSRLIQASTYSVLDPATREIKHLGAEAEAFVKDLTSVLDQLDSHKAA